MESLNFNGTLLAQMFNFFVMILFIVVLGVFILRMFTKRPGRLEEDIREIKIRLGEIERKIDKR